MIRLRPIHAALLVLVGLAAAQSPSTKNLNLRGGRFKPLTYDEMTPAQKTMIDHLLSGERAGTNGPFNVLLRSPEMGDLAQNLGAYLRYHSSLPRKLNEFAIVLTGRYWNAQYEFYAHRRLALEAGLDAVILDAIAAGQRPAKLSDDEATVYNFASELLGSGQVSDASYARVKDRFGERGVMDLVGAVGYYSLVSMVLNVDRVPLPAGVEPPLKPL